MRPLQSWMQAPLPEREQPATALNDTAANMDAPVSGARSAAVQRAGAADSDAQSTDRGAGAASAATLSTNGKSATNGTVVVVGPLVTGEGSSSMGASGGRVGSALASNGSLTADFGSSARPLAMNEGVSGQKTSKSSSDSTPDSNARPGSGMGPLQQHFLALLPGHMRACHVCLLTLSCCLHLTFPRGYVCFHACFQGLVTAHCHAMPCRG